MARSSEAAAVDSAWSTFESALGAWLAAGGSAALAVRWTNHKLGRVDTRLGAALARESVSPASTVEFRGATFAASDNLP
ncbi:hypothetical protein [Prosthecomicrobium pneumaticum]|uniref:Uncharacterized protein n=1 Tax=Prosthecomicrobium pneumaticum TaxID=81895 RepID=A0A7W9L3J5_9HYPH|nr:hypothetical protein [Prosthecomicrobium pneumaticum]MBB5754628.1 hypothetical protein [Prosthecomicrobium pneumaticum]